MLDKHCLNLILLFTKGVSKPIDQAWISAIESQNCLSSHHSSLLLDFLKESAIQVFFSDLMMDLNRNNFNDKRCLLKPVYNLFQYFFIQP